MRSLKFTEKHTPSGTILAIPKAQIWDNEAFCLFRERVKERPYHARRHPVVLRMAGVGYLASGFFGMLMDWCDQGIPVVLIEPEPNVRAMLWFREFTTTDRDGVIRVGERPGRTVPSWMDAEPDADDPSPEYEAA